MTNPISRRIAKANLAKAAKMDKQIEVNVAKIKKEIKS